MWAGNTTENGSILITYCAPGNCFFNTSGDFIWIPHNMTERINEFLCNRSNREGILCSQCQPGFGHAINSDNFQCVPCTSQHSKVNWIYYILSVYLPLLVVFIVIIRFNIHLTTGPANAFIIFAQAITTTLSLEFNMYGVITLTPVFGSGAKAILSSFQVPYNVMNLDLFSNILPPFCLTDDLRSLDILVLKYLEALFPVVIIMAVIFLLKYQSCSLKIKCPTIKWKWVSLLKVIKWKGVSLAQVFAAFVLLSYNRLCQISVYLILSVPMWDEMLNTVENRVFYSGNLLSSDQKYTIHYKLPAIIFLVILIIIPIALLHYPLLWLEKLVTKSAYLKRMYPTAAIAILLDTFQGCFRNNRRYFAGLYLAFRLLLFSAYSQTTPLQYFLQIVIIVPYILLIAALKPYKNVIFNYVDMCIFADMAFLSCISWYVEDAKGDQTVKVILVIAIILVYLPMLYIITYLIWHLTSCHHEKIKMKCSTWFNRISRMNSRTEHGCLLPHAVTQSDDTFIQAIDSNGHYN